MGCTQSKIENEEAVNRCKDRKKFMKDAVSARNAFAAAHSAYTMSLKNTGAALSDYAHGEVQHPHIPSSSGAILHAVAPAPYETFAPPPPLPNFSPSPLQRAASMPEISVHKPDLKHSDPIIEEENEEEIENESHSLKRRSSRSTGGGSRAGVSEGLAPPPPPSPPPTPPLKDRETPPPPPPESKGMSSWDFFFPSMENVPGPSLAEVDEGREEMEEMERKMKEERAKRSDVFDGGDSGRGRRSGKVEASEVAEVMDEAELPSHPPPPTKSVKKVKQVAPVEGKRGGKAALNVSLLQIFTELDDCFLRASESAHEVAKMLEAHRLHYHSNFADKRGHIDHSARVMRVITWNRSFRGLPNADDGKDESDSEENETHATVLDKMLAWEKKLYDEVKTGEQMKFEYQRKVASLNKLKKRNASTESIEKTKAALSHLHTRYIVDMQSMDSTVSEINRLRDAQLYPRLVALVDGDPRHTLHPLDHRLEPCAKSGGPGRPPGTAFLRKGDWQAASLRTRSGARNGEIHPEHYLRSHVRMATMWENMKIQHEHQSKAVTALKLLDISQSPKETSEHHHERTVQLWIVAREWHSQFEKLMNHQKEYLRALNSWLKLNLIPIDNNLKEKVSSPQRPQTPPIQSLLHAWHDFLEKLPDEHAKTAIFNFAAVIDTIVQYQVDEMKLRKKCEETRKDLVRKTRQFEDWYNKHMQAMQRKNQPDELDPDRAQDKDLVTERQIAVETVKKKLEEEEDDYQKQCIQVREKSLNTLKTRLPELFRAMSDFSVDCSDMYQKLRSIAQPSESA